MQILASDEQRTEILRLAVYSFVEAHRAGDDAAERISARAIALMQASDLEIRAALVDVRVGWQP